MYGAKDLEFDQTSIICVGGLFGPWFYGYLRQTRPNDLGILAGEEHAGVSELVLSFHVFPDGQLLGRHGESGFCLL